MKTIENKQDILNGMPFIGKYDERGHSRICENCIYGTDDTHPSANDVVYTGCSPKKDEKYFGVKGKTLNGKEIGNYCPDFNDYSNFE